VPVGIGVVLKTPSPLSISSGVAIVQLVIEKTALALNENTGKYKEAFFFTTANLEGRAGGPPTVIAPISVVPF
jgi:hypothetical protein